MSEIAVQVSAENLVIGGFVMGMVLSMIGAGVRILFSVFGTDDPQI